MHSLESVNQACLAKKKKGRLKKVFRRMGDMGGAKKSVKDKSNEN